ncbi:MAG: hypothetical protein EXS63_01920 [Candidatus Omnitrophica bacterium]|nr:hypothetical protein [Candidatus Omnitrophota bacterium]
MGTVTQYLAELSVAIVKVQKGAVQVNDLLAFEGEKTKFRQKITSLEMNHQPVTVGRVGEEVGMKVQDPVIEGDQVFRVDYVSAGR